MKKYVRARGSKTWHWCRNCEKWPTLIEEQTDDRPRWDLCNECNAKEDRGDCTSK